MCSRHKLAETQNRFPVWLYIFVHTHFPFPLAFVHLIALAGYVGWNYVFVRGNSNADILGSLHLKVVKCATTDINCAGKLVSCPWEDITDITRKDEMTTPGDEQSVQTDHLCSFERKLVSDTEMMAGYDALLFRDNTAMLWSHQATPGTRTLLVVTWGTKTVGRRSSGGSRKTQWLHGIIGGRL